MIEVSAADPADNPQYRKIVTYHQDVLALPVPLDNVVQALPSALDNIGEPFTARDMNVRRFAPPAQKELAVSAFNFVKGEPFQLPVVEFTDAVFYQHRQIVRTTDRLGGLAGAAQITGVDRVEFLSAKEVGNLLGLALPQLA